MNDDMKIGIIGCGNIADVHLKYVTRRVKRSGIALCDLDENRLEDAARRWGIAARYTGLDAMLKDFKPDAAHVLTPPAAHKDAAVRCLQGGCHVLIEKPMCLTDREAGEITAAAAAAGRLVCVDHMRLYDPQYLKVRELLASGKLGSVVCVTGYYSHDVLEKSAADPTARWTRRLNGGMLFDVAPHMVYLLEDLLPGLEHQNTVLRKDAHGNVTDVLAVFASRQGAGMVNISLRVFPLQNQLFIECTRGHVRLDLRNFVTTVRIKSRLPNAAERVAGNLSAGMQTLAGTVAAATGFARGKIDPYRGLETVIRDFYRAVRGGGASPVPAEKGRILARLLEDMFAPAAKREKPAPARMLRPADVLVTGGTGFIGRPLVARLAGKGYRVRVLSHQDPDSHSLDSLRGRNVEIVRGDVYDPDDVKNACEGVETVYHLAAAMKGSWNYFLDTTISGTKNIMAAARRAGVRRVVYVSTLNVLNAKEYPHNGIVDEMFPYEDMPERRGNYSNAKLKAEKIVLDAAKDAAMSVIILRPGLVYGPGAPSFLRDVGFRIGGRLNVVLGMGGRRIPLIYVDNLVDALALAGESKGKGTAIYNVVDGDYPTQNSFVRLYRRITGQNFLNVHVPMAVLFPWFSAMERALYLLMKKKVSLSYKLKCVNRSVIHSTLRIESSLGWRQNVRLEEGLRAAVKSEREKEARACSRSTTV